MQEGQQLAPGANVARVAKPGMLYAELRIPELDARDLAAGLPATIDMRDRLVRGRVDPRGPGGDRGRGEGRDRIRRAAAVAGARRPLGRRHHRDRDAEEACASSAARSARSPVPTTTVFRAKPGDTVAERVPVKFGKASVNQIVVLEGLEPGDIVALADTTQWSGKDRLVID